MILLFNKTPIIIIIKYFNYNNIFLIDNTKEFSRYIKINNYIIKLKKNKQPLFRFFYSFKPKN